MKTKLILTSALIASFIFTGCSNKELTHEDKEEITQEKKEKQENEIEKLPKWVINPDVKNGLATVGMSNFSNHGFHTMLTMAEMDARAKLAGKISTKVSQLQKKSMRHMKIEDINELEEVFSQVTKELVKDIEISGAKRVDLHQGGDGTLYVLMSMDNSNVSKQLTQKYNSYSKNKEMSKENLDQGMIVLDKMIDDLEKESKE